jgi:aryl-alcohol dehydrogenase-like predicted oxidoreductase
MSQFEARTLGRTGLTAGPLGISASYGVGATGVERAVDAGMTYLYWGSMRRAAFGEGLRRVSRHRDRLTLVLQSYSRVGRLMTWSVERALRRVAFDRADVLLLGYWNAPVPARILDTARTLRERGLVRFLAVSSHNRPLAAAFARSGDFDLVHVRYNAAHPGAETDVFPLLPAERRPGLVAFTATSWGQLLNPRFTPPGERTPTAADCYRFALSHPAVDLCVTGPANDSQVDAAIAARSLGPLSPDEVAWMKRVGAAVRRRAWVGRTGPTTNR